MIYKTNGFSAIRKRGRYIAAFFALNLLFEIVAPLKLWALTGGPSQPESSSFEPVGTTDMVDLFTGDFNYNIPLFDIGGYPMNISYHGGVSMDQEASWVGLGWNINPGAINRGMRGLPDDFLADEVKKEMNMKKQTTLSLKTSADLEIFGFLGNKNKSGKKGTKEAFDQSKRMDKLGKLSLGFGVVFNNYKGVGYSLDLSAEISKTNQEAAESKYKNDIARTKSASESALGSARAQNRLNDPSQYFTSSKSKLKANVSLNVSSQDGASWGAGLSYSGKVKEKGEERGSITPSIGLGYNSYLGMTSFDAGIGGSGKQKVKDGIKASKNRGIGLNSYIPIGNYTYTPSVGMAMLSTSNSLNVTIGFDAFGGHPNMRFSGFYNTEELETQTTSSNAYGYLYEQESYWNRESDHVMMDFNREKESKGNKSATHLPLANHTYDIYSVSGQGTGGMYRPHRKNLGILHDNNVRSRNKTGAMWDLGVELGFGANAHFGVNIKNKRQRSSSGIWREDNDLMDFLKYRMRDDNDPNPENRRYKQTYFKAAGEQTPSDNELGNSWGGKQAVSLNISKVAKSNMRLAKLRRTFVQSTATPKDRTETNVIRNNVISYLTAEESGHQGIGLDPYIISYPQNYWSNYVKRKTTGPLKLYKRFGGENGARAHHISEIISNSGDGMRYVYGLPAYNTLQQEVSFAVSKDYVSHPDQTERNEDPKKGLVEYNPVEGDNSILNARGQDNFFMSSTMPSYAHSYLLTGVLSPDYADLTGDGITDDDYGSAVKFNYYKTPGQYQWRTPYEENRGNLDQGFLTDNSDNKASYVYGKKEIWYLQSMESKTHIAEFKLSPRNDGRGVKGPNGGLGSGDSNTLMKLDSIVIFSKIDLLRNGSAAVPVKTIVFQYDYSLCKGIPNSTNTALGKLTLKKIYFTYQNSGKGVLNPYKFTYSDFNPNYSHEQYDRWGTYKYANEKLPNRDFPYLDYDTQRDTFDKYASAWNLSQIELPSGGKINVQYEADDYAYVQDKKAMQMFNICGAGESVPGKIIPQSPTAELYDGKREFNYLFFKVNTSMLPKLLDNSIDRREYFKEVFLRDENGKDKDFIYYRFKVNMDPRAKGANSFEYISGYARINTDDCGFTDDNSYAFVKLISVNQGDVGLTNCNPISKQAWQIGMQHLRKVMYPGSDLSQGDKESAMKALVNSFGQALNIFTGPYQNLRWKNIAKNFETEKSYIRLNSIKKFKVGGGSRVKKITINDNWYNMDTEQESGQYGQEFSYITKTNPDNNSGDVISSGVASYEPFVGNDENPWRVPSFYTTNRFMFPDLNEYLEEPFGESFFPSATIGYSRVVVRNIPKPGAVVTSTGKVVHEFFTAKDFPVILEHTPLKYITNGNGNSTDGPGTKKAKKFAKSLASLFSLVKRDYMAATQGYVIRLNDMHGKPKSTAIYSSEDESSDATEKQFTGRLISGTEYKYKTETSENKNSFNKVFELQDSSRFKPIPRGSRLANTVWVMKENGQLEQKEIAMSYDVAVDTRQSNSHFRHAGLDFNTENFMVYLIPCPYPKYSVTESMFQSAVVTKVVQQYGVLEEVVAYDHSSIVKTKNLVWDEQTGQVLLTATTNEFEDPIYNYTYPAHLAYEGMGPAYKNIDFETSFTVVSRGNINVSTLGADSKSKFYPGDELLLKNSDKAMKAWVLNAYFADSTGGYSAIRLIDIAGQPIAAGTWDARIIRSGKRNLASVPVGAITTMNRNIYNYDGTTASKRLNLNTDIVQSSAAVFTDQWQGYLDRAAYHTLQCDTTSLVKEDVYEMIKAVIESGHSSDYVFHLALIAPPATTLDAYEGDLKESVEAYANAKTVDCGGGIKILDSVRFGRQGLTGSSFIFKADYLCPSGSVITQTLPCEIIIAPTDVGCGLDLFELESVGPMVTINSSTVRFKGYGDGDSCLFQITYPPTGCFQQVTCKYVLSCDYFAGKTINPYVNNIRGVWRQKEAFAFNSGRTYTGTNNNTNTNIRKDGYVTAYKPFWEFKWTSRSGVQRSTASGTEKWVSTGEATMYAPEGNGLEEKDALGIYSSQLFGYNNLLVTAQAGNARHAQIAFDNFEDYLSPQYYCTREGHFDFREGLNFAYSNSPIYDNPNVYVAAIMPQGGSYSNGHIAKDTAHTGRYSLCVHPTKSHSNVRRIDFSGLSFAAGTDSMFRLNSMSQVITPFAPTPGKYVVSAWVYEKFSDQNAVNTYGNAVLNVKVYDGGSAVVNQNFSASGMIIEKWQRLEGVFTIPSGADSIKVTLVNNGSVNAYFDDVRLHPFDAKMAGHVYHDVLLKVMAELDDNNYATFYEYDDEGSLVRVKRETEKGIVTIQESRKSIRKTTP